MNYLRRLPFISLLLGLLAAAPASAQVYPIVFERADIAINPTNLPPANDGEAYIVRPSSRYNIELRSEEAARLEYIHTLNNLTDDSGVMIMFVTPAMVPLPAMQVFTPVDAIFVAEDGTILQIAPNVTLGEMTQDIMSPQPIKALLFLKAGTAIAKRIQPQDVVAGGMFTPAPPVMQ
jgi:uncharacterized membrane protein (UPF0127 family)